eukprot:1191563-Prorocentrum_minimum.AAC.1
MLGQRLTWPSTGRSYWSRAQVEPYASASEVLRHVVSASWQSKLAPRHVCRVQSYSRTIAQSDRRTSLTGGSVAVRRRSEPTETAGTPFEKR